MNFKTIHTTYGLRRMAEAEATAIPYTAAPAAH